MVTMKIQIKEINILSVPRYLGIDRLLSELPEKLCQRKLVRLPAVDTVL